MCPFVCNTHWSIYRKADILLLSECVHCSALSIPVLVTNVESQLERIVLYSRVRFTQSKESNPYRLSALNHFNFRSIDGQLQSWYFVSVSAFLLKLTWYLHLQCRTKRTLFRLVFLFVRRCRKCMDCWNGCATKSWILQLMSWKWNDAHICDCVLCGHGGSLGECTFCEWMLSYFQSSAVFCSDAKGWMKWSLIRLGCFWDCSRFAPSIYRNVDFIDG